MTAAADQEQRAIAWALQNPEAFWGLRERMGETTFQSEPWRTLWPPLVKAWDKHETFPTADEVAEIVRPLKLEQETKHLYTHVLRNLYTLDVGGFSGGEVVEWIAFQELERLGKVLESSHAGKHTLAQQLQFAEERLEKIRGLTGKKTFGRVFNLDADLERWKDDVEETYAFKPVTTGFFRLNQKLRNGGLRNFITLLVGATGGFKTTTALQMGYANMRSIRATHPDGRVLGGRVVHFFTDDNAGEIKQRRHSHLLQRPVSAADYEEGNWRRIGRQMKARASQEYPGEFHGVEIDPDEYTPRDFFRYLEELQAQYVAEDKKLLREGWTILNTNSDGSPMLGQINLVTIDVGDQVKPSPQSYSKNSDQLTEEKKYGELRKITQRLRVPLIVTVQGNQALVGASQGTMRNIGTAYGKAKTPKLVLVIAQTFRQSQNTITVDPTQVQVKDNLHNMWAFNPSSDRNTAWEAFSLCVVKNTYGNGDAGYVRNVAIPMLAHLGSSRIIEDYTAADELLRSPKETETEERVAAGEIPSKGGGKKGPK